MYREGTHLKHPISVLQEERARARSLGKQVKVLEDAKDQLEKDLREENVCAFDESSIAAFCLELFHCPTPCLCSQLFAHEHSCGLCDASATQDKRRKLQFDKDTILRCMPELHIVMKTMLEGQFAQISRRDMQNLLPSPDFDVDVEHSNINRVHAALSCSSRFMTVFFLCSQARAVVSDCGIACPNGVSCLADPGQQLLNSPPDLPVLCWCNGSCGAVQPVDVWCIPIVILIAATAKSFIQPPSSQPPSFALKESCFQFVY